MIVVIFYILAAITRRNTDVQGNIYNPLVITAGVFGRASLSNLQLFYFSLIVLWILVYNLVHEKGLVNLSTDVLVLLGIGAAGTAGAKLTAVVRDRLSYENWAWLKHKGWIEKDIGRARRPPQWTDLLTSQDAFDVSKFQTLFVSFSVGVALLMEGFGQPSGAATFEIPEGLLGLLGLSQGINVTNKAISPSPNAELDKLLNEVRELESKFVAKVAEQWGASPPSPADLDAAKKAARPEYDAYLHAAKRAAVMVQERIGARSPTTLTDPDIPA
jgi:hypothetical protein